jgi:hypothetical protein
MSTNNAIENYLSSTLKTTNEINNITLNLSNFRVKQQNISQHMSCSTTNNQDIPEKRERSNSNTVNQLDELFLGLVKKIKKEKPQTIIQKNSIARYYCFLYKSQIQSTIELNNINPLSTQTFKLSNPINAGK